MSEFKIKKSSDENEITIGPKFVKPGDLILYEMVSPISFHGIRKDHLAEDIRSNFMILIDKLICFAEDSMITHSALITEDLRVVEATIPALQTRTFQREENFYIHVRRVEDGKDGSIVLQHLPQSVEGVEADPDSYAMIMAVYAGLACLFRVPEGKTTSALMKILKCVLYMGCEFLDKKLLPFSHGDSNWFCSELTSFTYNMTAIALNDPAYKLSIPTSENIAETIIQRVLDMDDLEQDFDSKSDFKDLKIEKPEELDNLYTIATDFFDNKQTPANEDTAEIIKSNSKFIIKVLKKLFSVMEIDYNNFIEQVVKFQSAFVMPSDLYDCLPNKYWISDARTEKEENN